VTRSAVVGTVAIVKGGWLEHEIRSLPQVLACSITPDDVVVLVEASADPSTVESRVAEVLRRVGIDARVRVFGGERPVFVEPVRIRNGKAAVVGSIGGAAILAAGVWLAGATTALRGPRGKSTVITLAPPPPKRVVLIPVVGGDGSNAPLPTQEVTPPLLRPLKHHALVAHHALAPPAPRPSVSPSEPPPPAPKPAPEPEHKLLDVGAIFDRIVLGGALR
jgi:hypothetical protein